MATPLAASIGDLIAISMLSISVAFLYKNLGGRIFINQFFENLNFFITVFWIFNFVTYF